MPWLTISSFSPTSGSPYYDNVRPLCYSDSDAVLLCFDISRPETVDSALKKVSLDKLYNLYFSLRTKKESWGPCHLISSCVPGEN